MFLPGQPFEACDGLIGSSSVPASRWLRSDGLGWNHFLAPESVTGGSDGDTFLEGIKVSFLLEFLAELLASSFQQFHVRLAIRFHFSAHHKLLVGLYFLLVPPFKFRFLFGGHAVRVVRVSRWHGSFVRLVL